MATAMGFGNVGGAEVRVPPANPMQTASALDVDNVNQRITQENKSSLHIEQTEAVQLFSEFTANELDEQSAIELLRVCNWNVEQAVQLQLEGYGNVDPASAEDMDNVDQSIVEQVMADTAVTSGRENWPRCFSCGIHFHPDNRTRLERRVDPNSECPNVCCGRLDCREKLKNFWVDLRSEFAEMEKALPYPSHDADRSSPF